MAYPGDAENANQNRLSRRMIRTALIVYAISCFLHGAALLALGKDLQACCIAGDSAEYLELSNTRFSDLNRTPGYPVFLRVVRQIFGPSLEPVLWVQVFLISLVPALVALFAGLAFPRFPSAAYISGLLSSVSFTGIRLGHMILTEALFVPFVMAALVALYFGTRESSGIFVVLSAVLGGLAFLVKPIFLFWWAFIPASVFFFAGQRKILGKVILAAMTIGLAFPLGWSLVNVVKYRVFTPSWNGVATACIYWGARTLALVEDPTPGKDRVEAHKQRILAIYQSLGTLVERYRFFSKECPSILVAHPRAAMRAYRTSAFENLPRPFSTTQLHWYSSSAPVSMNPLLLGVNHLNTLLYGVAFLGALRMFVEKQGRLLLGLLLFFGIFWLITGTSYGQRSRLMYPVEPVLMILSGFALARKEKLPPPSSADPVKSSI
jgi:hypothetical protein